jgi:hypothetical protein
MHARLCCLSLIAALCLAACDGENDSPEGDLSRDQSPATAVPANHQSRVADPESKALAAPDSEKLVESSDAGVDAGEEE